MSEVISKLRPQDRIVLEQLKVLRESLLALDADMATDEDLLLATLDGETPVLDQLRHIVRVALEAQDWGDAIRQREKILAARRHRMELKAERCRTFVREAMQTLGLPSLMSDDFSASVRLGQASLQIDMDKLPRAYKRIIEEPDKPMIRSALANDKEVPGVTLGNASPVLTVRTS